MAWHLLQMPGHRPPFGAPMKPLRDIPPLWGLHREGCEGQAAIWHQPRKEMLFSAFAARFYRVLFLRFFCWAPAVFLAGRNKNTSVPVILGFIQVFPGFSIRFFVWALVPNFEFRKVSRSVFMEPERRAPGETLTRGSPFQFREHGR